MNNRDLKGFDLLESLELLCAKRCVLLEFRERDLRQWMINVNGDVAGFIDQWGNGRFWVRSKCGGVVDYMSGGMDEQKLAFSHLEDAVAAVEFGKIVRDRCGVRDGMRQ
jgi:hypothetical protein